MTKIDVINPLTLESLYELQPADQEAIDQVYQKARSVQPTIAALSVDKRVKEIVKISKYIIDNHQLIVERLVSETGKTKFEALSNELF